MGRLQKFMALLSGSVLSLLLWQQIALAEPAPNTSPFTLQVLGSGGPDDVDGRASSSYLIWLDGKARFMIDAGGGASLRFAEAGANIEDLKLLAISHLHVDHSIDVATMIKRGFFYNREDPLPVAGPSGNDFYPDIKSFLNSFFNEEHGAYRYMTICDGYPKAEAKIIDAAKNEPSLVYQDKENGISVTALAVGHAHTPTLAYRINTPYGSVAFASDQNDRRQKQFTEFVKGVDILVMHFPRDERKNRDETFWHANPSTVGQVARDAQVKKLVLSHFMKFSLKNIDENVAIVKKYYKGDVKQATDLAKYPISSTQDK